MKVKLEIEIDCDGDKCGKCEHLSSSGNNCFKFRDKGNLPEPIVNKKRCKQCLAAEIKQ